MALPSSRGEQDTEFSSEHPSPSFQLVCLTLKKIWDDHLVSALHQCITLHYLGVCFRYGDDVSFEGGNLSFRLTH